MAAIVLEISGITWLIEFRLNWNRILQKGRHMLRRRQTVVTNTLVAYVCHNSRMNSSVTRGSASGVRGCCTGRSAAGQAILQHAVAWAAGKRLARSGAGRCTNRTQLEA